MPTMTLRITDEEQHLLQTMAQMKRMSVSQLARSYLKAGFDSDAKDGDLQAKIQTMIVEEQQRLESLAKIIQEAVATATPEEVHATEGP